MVDEFEFSFHRLRLFGEAERHEQSGFGPGDRHQLADATLQHHGVFVGDLLLKPDPPTGVKAGIDESRAEVSRQTVNAPPRCRAPSLGLGRCRGCLGFLLALPLGHQFGFGVPDDVGHLLPVRSSYEEVRADVLAMRDVRAGLADRRQPYVAAHDREPFLAPPQEGAKTVAHVRVVIHRPEELAADVGEGNLIDDVVPGGRPGWRQMTDRRDLPAVDPQVRIAHELDLDASGAEECQQAVDSRQSAPQLPELLLRDCRRLPLWLSGLDLP